MEGKTAQALWQDYQFLTKEMMKFLAKQDMELFYNLMKQRERLQAVIEQTEDDGFKVSPAGHSLLNEIWQENQNITENLQARFRNIKRKHQVAEAYSGSGTAQASRMNWKR